MIDAVKTQAMLDKEEPAYQPSMLRRWPDEPSRYAYLWEARFERGAELVLEDAAFMDAFEQTATYQRNFKALYDSKLEMRNFRQAQSLAS